MPLAVVALPSVRRPLQLPLPSRASRSRLPSCCFRLHQKPWLLRSRLLRAEPAACGGAVRVLAAEVFCFGAGGGSGREQSGDQTPEQKLAHVCCAPMAAEPLLLRHAKAGLAAAAEALFPANDYGAPDYRETELVPRTVEYWDLLPPRQRRLLVVLFASVELLSPLLVRGGKRFSRHPPSVREGAVRAWRRSALFPLRILGDALKASLTVLYMSHPRALSHVGARRGGMAALHGEATP